MDLDIEALRKYHRDRMKSYSIPYNRDYEDRIIKRIEKERDSIWLHDHWLNEVGMCIDCDAAALLNYSAEIAPEL